ncbi:glycosyltransferase [Thermosynechococcaceae cyanobacterium BACA0444]|uniref:Glycosyltransferase n=1 Tax=Pseudocalidococcus azoricus BACA0444 TaxID=2918990 RepID=A0AAE4FN87_9CYAN|nr:glycosyltransferase [Pseudocalidococcus azoricus]MDS3859218.1 glycosyltransferase [Pseudocalidococcus azoricus BACA0444]
MILVTVGTEQFPFDRLMSWINALIKQKFLDPAVEEILVQYGSCQVVPKGVQAAAVFPEDSFKTYIKQARVIISHCGEGSVYALAASGNPYILVPRHHAYQEHVDNHQEEWAKMLEKQGIAVAWELADLVRFLADPQVSGLVNLPSESISQMLTQRFG